MKSLKIVLSLIALGLVASAPLQAQKKGKGQQMDPKARVEALDQAVTLTEAQKPQVLEIYTKLAEDIKVIDPADRATKGRELQTAAREKVMALLTDDQKKNMPAEGRGGKKKKG